MAAGRGAKSGSVGVTVVAPETADCAPVTYAGAASSTNPPSFCTALASASFSSCQKKCCGDWYWTLGRPRRSPTRWMRSSIDRVGPPPPSLFRTTT